MKVVESKSGAPRKLMVGGVVTLVVAVGLVIWNGASKEEALVPSTSENKVASGGSTTKGTVASGSSGSDRPANGSATNGSASNGASTNQGKATGTNGEVVKEAPKSGGTTPGREELASMMKVSGRAKPPADAPSVEELISRMPDGSPVPPYEPPVEEPVVENETVRVLTEVERRASSDPEATAAWVEAMPKGELRDESIAFVVEQWSKKDAAKAKSWKDRLEAEARSF